MFERERERGQSTQYNTFPKSQVRNDCLHYILVHFRHELNGEPLFLSSVSPVTNHVRDCQYCGLERVFELQLMPYLVSCLHQVEEQPRGELRTSNGTSPVIDMHETQRKRTDSGRFFFSDSDYENRVEFGCIYVYTCKASCWSDDDIFRQELVCVQADPDDAILA